MSSLTVEEDQKWFPTHVQVTVLRGRGVRGKGKHGTSDVYTIIQLGKEKYSTCVAEKTTEPEWREECSFELQPGVLETGCPAGSNELVLVAMHRAAMGLDVFLGQAVIQLDQVFHHTRCVRNEWYKLKSKTGKKEKERGDIQVTVQFTRNNLTASMYDLVMKDKGASTFGKLKERIKGKRRCSEEDSASAALPSGYGSLVRMRQRLPSDGGGEEDYEDDEGGEARRSKMRTFFLRGKLRKSADTRSSTSLGSESSESSSRGGSLSPTAGISVVVSDLSNSPSNSSNLTADNSPDHTKSSSLICEFGDEDGEITIAVPRPAACVNGVRPPDPGKPAAPSGLAPLQKSLPLSVSLQNLRPSTDLLKSPVGDGRRWSFDKPCEEEKAAIAAALEQSGPMLGDEQEEEEEEEEGQLAPPGVASSSRVESESRGKRQRKDLLNQCEQAAEQKQKGWFGSKASHGKPSLVVSPKLEPSTDPHPPPGALVAPAPLVPPLHHTNPFSHSHTTAPPISPCNPFFSLLQHNPFYGAMLTAQSLKPALPPLPHLSSARPPIAQLFPQADPPAEDGAAYAHTLTKGAAMGEAAQRLPGPSPDSEWDECFDAFAAVRLQCPEDPTAAHGETQRSAAGWSADKGASLPVTDANTDANGAPYTGAAFQATGTLHPDTFAQFLETIPEHDSFECDDAAFGACSETNQADSATNHPQPSDVHRAPPHQPPHPPSVKLGSSSPDPGSSGIGGSEAAEDFLSCRSSFSHKFSASSSGGAEVRSVGSDTLRFERSSGASAAGASESQDDDAADVARHALVQNGAGVDLSGLEGSSAPLSPRQHDTKAPEDAVTPSPNLPELPESREPSQSEVQFNGSAQDSPADFFDSFVPVSDTTGVMTFTVPEDSLAHPSLRIITSSPEASRSSPNPFGFLGDFLDASNMASGRGGRDFSDTLLPAPDWSGGSVFLQSLSASADSQDYQTCESHQTSKRSADSTLCGELNGAHATSDASAALGPEGSGDACEPRAGAVHGWDGSADLEPSFVMAEASGFLPASCDLGTLAEGRVGRRRVASERCEAQSAPLNRSHSEGALAPAFDELLPPTSFGSDPGAAQEPPSARPGPRPPSLTSFAPCLTPRSSSSPVALFSLPPLANAAPRSPTSTPPKPVLEEPPTRQEQAANQENSPHPVKPLTAGPPSVLEKLKSSIHPGRSSQPSEQEADRKKPVTEGAGSYYHLNHRDLVDMLVQREAELERQKAEFERQKLVLAKREVELRKLKPQVKDLEDYIDTLLVRIMEQKPTLLQVRSKLK
ncbi:uncharacterized protein rab11fip5a [Spinachia spinachia]